MDNRAAQRIREELARLKSLDPPQGQKDLAERLGMSQSFLSRLASGEKTPRLWEDGESLRRELGIELGDFNLPAEEPAA